MKLKVRNTLSELLLEALHADRFWVGSGESWIPQPPPHNPQLKTIQWLLAYCLAAEGRRNTKVPLIELGVGGQGSGVGEEALKLLQALDLFRIQNGSIELLPEFQADLPTIRRKAEAYLKVLSHLGPDREAGGWGLEQAIRDAAVLFNEGLYFEFHELLEPFWMAEVDEQRKAFLKGLIQIAVAFHHLFNRNYRGALALLQGGLEKAQGCGPRFYRLHLDGFLKGLKRCLLALEHDPQNFDPGLVPKMEVGCWMSDVGCQTIRHPTPDTGYETDPLV